jgi:hypothetical protein
VAPTLATSTLTHSLPASPAQGDARVWSCVDAQAGVDEVAARRGWLPTTSVTMTVAPTMTLATRNWRFTTTGP